jgi:hypothetical protein
LASLELANIGNYKLSFKSIIFNNARYPVHRFNDQVSWTEDDSKTDFTLTATLTHQSYTGAQLATQLAAAFTAESLASGHSFTYTSTYDSQTKKIRINLTDGLPNVYKLIDVTYNAYRLMGFTPSEVAAETLQVFQEGDTIIDLSGTKYVDMHSRNLSTSNVSSSGSSSIVCRVPLTASFGEVNYYEPQVDSLTLRNDLLTEIDISLRDDEGNSYELDSNHSVAINLEFLM